MSWWKRLRNCLKPLGILNNFKRISSKDKSSFIIWLTNSKNSKKYVSSKSCKFKTSDNKSKSIKILKNSDFRLNLKEKRKISKISKNWNKNYKNSLRTNRSKNIPTFMEHSLRRQPIFSMHGTRVYNQTTLEKDLSKIWWKSLKPL